MRTEPTGGILFGAGAENMLPYLDQAPLFGEVTFLGAQLEEKETPTWSPEPSPCDFLSFYFCPILKGNTFACDRSTIASHSSSGHLKILLGLWEAVCRPDHLAWFWSNRQQWVDSFLAGVSSLHTLSHNVPLIKAGAGQSASVHTSCLGCCWVLCTQLCTHTDTGSTHWETLD